MGFHSDSEIGNKGENIIYDYLWKHKSTLKIVDVSRDEWFQQFDIDFLQIDIQNNINKIEDTIYSCIFISLIYVLIYRKMNKICVFS